ncbi:MAG TPA: asparagine synthase (glutamine-hydrolyzing) [Rhodospirillaceae bacterium]|nr:asparagine synthase (glutamine-hydrolyzing) [Rhodospirillaceae bacterium]
MCGIAGFFLNDRALDEVAALALAERMTDRIVHRGPDDSGIEVITAGSSLLALGHRRLSVVDLTEAGRQPMVSGDGRFTIIYNGEVYALEALREALLASGYVFRGHSDTEVILEYCARWGVERCLPKLEGMFAFALWDEREKTLTLARDQAGIKPLYWMKRGSMFGFASELKALMPLLDKDMPSISRRGQLLYAHNGYIPAPYTIYEDVHKLLPGHFLTLRTGEETPSIKSYWTWSDFSQTEDSADWNSRMHEVLSESVRVTLDADVPVGCFLSGGIDSSLVTALMQSHSRRPVKTFAIGFEQEEFNEAPFAKAVAQHLGTDHTEMIVGEKDMLDVVPMLSGMYDEPFSDSSQIPTYLVSKLARERVTVSLSGDGGDELFSGYRRYGWAVRASSVAAFMPRGIRDVLGAITPGLRPVIGGPSRLSSYMGLLGASDFDGLYDVLLAYDTPLKKADEKEMRAFMRAGSSQCPMGAKIEDKVKAMRRIDFRQYMVDDVLTKVDRASMAVSLETRVPLLNRRVIDMACRLPIERLTDGKTGKIILRDILAQYVPRQMFDRPKMGFGVPLAAWIRGPLKDMVVANIEKALAGDAPFDPARTRKALSAHLRGERDNSYILWLISAYGGWRARVER